MKRIKKNFSKQEHGATLTLVIVYSAVFLIIFSSLIGFVYLQLSQTRQKVAFNQALAIAEAGADWSRWHLAHAPNDYNFSGTYDYKDPEGDTIGQYALEVSAPSACETSLSIKSTGWASDYPNVKRSISVKFGRPSLAQYAFLTDSDVWLGEEEDVKGPLHSNGGVRMDGTQNALFTSATSTYKCLPMHGCSSPYEIKPGIWGSGSGGTEGLWEFPVPSVDFDAISLDLGDLRDEARYHGGYYFGPSEAFGYRVEFKNDGSFNLYKVTKLKSNVWGADTDGVWHYESNDIGTGNSTTLLGNYPLTADGCDARNLIFIEDTRVWVDGVLKEKATVAAARFPDDPETNASIIINGSISRADPTDTMLALIAQKNILVPRYSDNILEIQAVMVAQKGAVQRYYYSGDTKNRIMVRGSIITNKIWTWSWIDSFGDITSGYEITESYYEPALIYNPPPYFPSSGEQQFVSWEETN
ncbi:MAG: hypothetical protein HY764_01395 [Candidatus Portnoybacteria bacterium]|nr:hypothetical protein [Candidatus Portnoybacteria bacterium]